MTPKRTSKKSVRPLYDPRRHHGRASIGFGVGASPRSWSAVVGREFSIPMTVRSTGGAGAGLWVRVSGDALPRLKQLSVRMGESYFELKADGDGLRAELPEVPLVLGVVYPLDPKPKNDTDKVRAQGLLEATQIAFELRGIAQAEGREMLRIGVGALNSDAPPMKWMRPLVVESSSLSPPE